MEKVRKDGKVAVLYSPNYGPGWYTYDYQSRDMVFDKEIIETILDGDFEKADKLGLEKYPDENRGLVHLRVYWIEEGAQFEIEEFDGSESIHVIGSREYFVA